MKNQNIIALSRLRPTQISVGMLEVKQKRKRIRALSKQPSELIAFILERPIRVVLGPRDKVYVVDHHHLALALIKEAYETAPMEVLVDLSHHQTKRFWQEMKKLELLYLYDETGKQKTFTHIPECLTDLKDDPYRSLAGFVREAGGYKKSKTPYAEFLWADYFRTRIKEKQLMKNLNKALKKAIDLAHHPDARKLPGYIKALKK